MANTSHEQLRKPYRAPEMAGPQYVPAPDARARGDDVIKRPAMMITLLVAVAVIVGFGALYLS